MGAVSALQVTRAVQDYTGRRFRGDVQTHGFGRDVVLVVVEPKPSTPVLRNFREVMWDYDPRQVDMGSEASFETAISEVHLPLPVLETQVREVVYRPPVDTVPLLPGDQLQRLSQNFGRVLGGLSKKKRHSYVRGAGRPETESRLFEYFEYRAGQQSLRDVLAQTTATNRDTSVARLRYDVVLAMSPRNGLGELKRGHTTAPGDIVLEVAQLTEYDGALEMRSDRKRTPILRITPTVPSLVEQDMCHGFQEETGRTVVPVAVTTPEYLGSNLRDRIAGIESFFARCARGEFEPNPAVVSAQEAELDHLLRWQAILPELRN